MIKKTYKKIFNKKFDIVFKSEFDFIEKFTNSNLSNQIEFINENPEKIYYSSSLQGTLLFYLSVNKKKDILNYIVDNLEIDRNHINYQSPDKLNILFKLIYLKDLELIKKFIAKGLAIDTVDSKNRNILYYAIHEEWIDAIDYFLGLNINTDIKDFFGLKPFEYTLGKEMMRKIKKNKFIENVK